MLAPPQRCDRLTPVALTEDQCLLRDTIRDFCAREIAPHCAAWDEEERFPQELMPRLAELGLMGIRIPEEYGGSALGTVEYALAVEQIARTCGSVALTVASHNGLGTGHILSCGTKAQKARYLPPAASAQWLAAWALTEPGSGSDSAALSTRARRDGDDWVLSGSKTFITQGSVCGFCVVLARTDPDVSAAKGITAFIVDAGTPGFSVSSHLKKYGCRASDTAELHFDDVRLSDEQRLGEANAGFIDTMRILDRGRISIGAMAIGLGRGAIAYAVGYAKERKTFGVPIGQHAAVGDQLAQAQVELDAGARMIYRAAELADDGEPYAMDAAMAKLFASEAGTRACNVAMQVLGGHGYMREHPVERYLRDVKLCEIGEGTSEIQRLVLAKHLLATG